MHIVHIKENHPNISEAIKDPTGVAVLGFLFEVILHSLAFFLTMLTFIYNIFNIFFKIQVVVMANIYYLF